MSKVKEAIEEMIEESYLSGLSEPEIRQDFKRFIDTCYSVIHKNVKDRDVVSGLAESLAREQTCILIADRTEARARQIDVTAPADGVKAPDVEFPGKVARRKRQILRVIAKCDPQLVRLIDAERFQAEIEEPRRLPLRRPAWHFNWQHLRLQLLKIGYATTVAIIILLIWLGLTHNP